MPGKYEPPKNFKWDPKLLKSALMIAENDMSDARIAEECGMSHSRLARHKLHPEFKAKVASHLEELEAEMLRLPIAKRRKRLSTLDDMHKRVAMLITDREDAYADNPEIVGGRTGMVVKQIKTAGSGKTAQVVEEYAFDRAVVAELRAIEEQAAKELGQWIDKGELTGKGGTPLVLTEIVIDRSNAAPESNEDEYDEGEGE